MLCLRHIAQLDKIRCFTCFSSPSSSLTDLPPPSVGAMATCCVCDWLLMDIYLFTDVGSDNFKATLMIVVIMLQTERRPQREASEPTSEVSFTR